MTMQLSQEDVQAVAQMVISNMLSGSGSTSKEKRKWSPYDGIGVTEKAVSSSPTNIYGHGNGGLFSAPGLSKPVFSAMLLPNQGLQSLLPVKPSNNDDNPLYGIFTGVTATTGSEPTGPCDDPPTAGLSKLCMHSFVFGRQSRQSRVFQIDRMGRITNRGEFLDLQLMNNPFGAPGTTPNVPTIPGANMADVLKNETAKALFELATSWSRDFAQEVYSGNPANNTSGQGRQYFYGLDMLINTGYRDAITQVACPAADSLLVSFGNNRVDLSASSAITIVTYMMRNLRYMAERTKLDPVNWVLAMRFGLFYELTQVWPLAYYTTRNTITDAGQNSFTQTKDTIGLRDDMRKRRYLLVDGEEVPVVLDEAIAETEPVKGVFSSSIYFVPLTVLGGTPVTYFEYVNYSAPGAAMDAAQVLAPNGSYDISDDGRFLWHRKPPTNFCTQMLALTAPRLLLLTPMLAGRITNMRYSPYMHERGSFTSDGYFANGGNTNLNGYGPSWPTPTP